MAALLDVKNLGISFGGLRAVNGFDISIEQGELYGLIGPNGAGKTTVNQSRGRTPQKMLIGILCSSSTAQVDPTCELAQVWNPRPTAYSSRNHFCSVGSG